MEPERSSVETRQTVRKGFYEKKWLFRQIGHQSMVRMKNDMAVLAINISIKMLRAL
jgi:hypothetical protein